MLEPGGRGCLKGVVPSSVLSSPQWDGVRSVVIFVLAEFLKNKGVHSELIFALLHPQVPNAWQASSCCRGLRAGGQSCSVFLDGIDGFASVLGPVNPELGQ